MTLRRNVASALAFAVVLLALSVVPSPAAAQPLVSWNDTPARAAILDFVRAATVDPASPRFVPAAERIATFDNDGTLWVEQPLYTQVVFAVDRVKELAPRHPEWRSEEPFKTLLGGNASALAEFSIQDFTRVIAVSHSGMTTDEFMGIARRWLTTAKHPRFKRLYTELVYQPMLELMDYLRTNGFKTYIVTGGGQEFVRTFAEGTYGVGPEQILGSAGQTKYGYAADGRSELVKQPKAMLIDDRGGKPEGINFMIGRRPVAAFGNSTGDQEMLEWTQTGGKNLDPAAGAARLMMLVHHDDAQREYAYGAKSKIGTFSDALMSEAKKRGWIVISMKDDWKRVFAFEN